MDLEGFIESQQCDYTLVTDDFNVDFYGAGLWAGLLTDFVSDHNSVLCDLSYLQSVYFTYERDDGLVHSWIDHVVCLQSLSSLVTDFHTMSCDTNLSDHYTSFFSASHSSLIYPYTTLF